MSWIPKIICVHWNQLEINVYIHIYIFLILIFVANLHAETFMQPFHPHISFSPNSASRVWVNFDSTYFTKPQISTKKLSSEERLPTIFGRLFFFSAIFVYFPSTPPNIYQSTTSGYPPNFWIKKHNTTGGAFNLFKNIKKNRIIVKLSSSSPIFP